MKDFVAGQGSGSAIVLGLNRVMTFSGWVTEGAGMTITNATIANNHGRASVVALDGSTSNFYTVRKNLHSESE